MQALILIELDDEHLVKETNDLYDRLHGYKCKLKPMPKKKIVLEHRVGGYTVNGVEMTEAHGWNACIDEITGETE